MRTISTYDDFLEVKEGLFLPKSQIRSINIELRLRLVNADATWERPGYAEKTYIFGQMTSFDIADDMAQFIIDNTEAHHEFKSTAVEFYGYVHINPKNDPDGITGSSGDFTYDSICKDGCYLYPLNDESDLFTANSSVDMLLLFDHGSMNRVSLSDKIYDSYICVFIDALREAISDDFEHPGTYEKRRREWPEPVIIVREKESD